MLSTTEFLQTKFTGQSTVFSLRPLFSMPQYLLLKGIYHINVSLIFIPFYKFVVINEFI